MASQQVPINESPATAADTSFGLIFEPSRCVNGSPSTHSLPCSHPMGRSNAQQEGTSHCGLHCQGPLSNTLSTNPLVTQEPNSGAEGERTILNVPSSLIPQGYEDAFSGFNVAANTHHQNTKHERVTNDTIPVTVAAKPNVGFLRALRSPIYGYNKRGEPLYAEQLAASSKHQRRVSGVHEEHGQLYTPRTQQLLLRGVIEHSPAGSSSAVDMNKLQASRDASSNKKFLPPPTAAILKSNHYSDAEKELYYDEGMQSDLDFEWGFGLEKNANGPSNGFQDDYEGSSRSGKDATVVDGRELKGHRGPTPRRILFPGAGTNVPPASQSFHQPSNQAAAQSAPGIIFKSINPHEATAGHPSQQLGVVSQKELDIWNADPFLTNSTSGHQAQPHYTSQSARYSGLVGSRPLGSERMNPSYDVPEASAFQVPPPSSLQMPHSQATGGDSRATIGGVSKRNRDAVSSFKDLAGDFDIFEESASNESRRPLKQQRVVGPEPWSDSDESDNRRPPQQQQQQDSGLRTTDVVTNSRDADPGLGFDRKPKHWCRFNQQGSFQVRKTKKDDWRDAIRHDDIRAVLYNRANVQGVYKFERNAGLDPGDKTSFHKIQRNWAFTPSNRRFWPKVLFQYMNDVNTIWGGKEWAEPQGEWKWEGRIVVDRDNWPLKVWPLLNDTCSTQIEAGAMEALFRICPKMRARDIYQRTPDVNGVPKNSTGFNARRVRFRDLNGLVAWTARAGSDTMRRAVEANIGQWGIDNNTTQHFLGFTKEELDVIKAENKTMAGSVKKSKAHQERRARLGLVKEEEDNQDSDDQDFDDGETDDGGVKDGYFENGELEAGELEAGNLEGGELEDGELEDGELDDDELGD